MILLILGKKMERKRIGLRLNPRCKAVETLGLVPAKVGLTRCIGDYTDLDVIAKAGQECQLS